MLSMAENYIAEAVTPDDRVLPIGTVLSDGQFTITDQLGAGGFGITYRAMDNVLGRTIVIKECFPDDFCLRDGLNVVPRGQKFAKPVRSIVTLFMREARSLAKLRHPNIVGVHRAFEENETAYMAIDLIDGRDLFDILEGTSRPLSPGRVSDILWQLLGAIEEVHNSDLLHRDISPDNIIIEKSGKPVLIDFGAARGDASRQTRAVSSLLVVKDGYSPQEFYTAGSDQTPSSDLYALAATFYHVISGEAPTNSQARMIEVVGHRPDPCIPLEGRIAGYDPEFLQAIDRAMALHPGDRLQSATQWKALIANISASDETSSIAAGRVNNDVSLELEMSLTRLVEETNDEVRKTTRIPVEPEKKVVSPQNEEAPKPEWIDEFNQETLAPKPRPSRHERPKAGDRPQSVSAFGTSRPISTSSSQAETNLQNSETNWIGLAKEKQGRMIAEREAELELFDDPITERIRSTVSKNTADEMTDPHAARDPGASSDKSKNWTVQILSGLLIGLVVAAYLQL